MSYRIKNIEQGTTTKVVLEDYDHGFQTGDKVKISGIGGDDNSTSMFQLNNLVFTVTQDSNSTKIILDSTDSSNYNMYDTTLSTRGVVTRVGGKLLHVEGDFQTDGTLLEISGNKLVNGTALKITGGAHMRHGSLVDIVTTSTHLQNGALNIMADAVETGRIISVSGDSLLQARWYISIQLHLG